MSRKIRMGMIGGGRGAFIGPVHHLAAELDGRIELVCGVFSSNADRSMASGMDVYGLARDRCYPDVDSMLRKELALPADQRMEFAAIVTPNHLHASQAAAVAAAGFAVVCDKPLSHSLNEAEQLQSQLRDKPVPFLLTHNYTGYPMIREARALIADGVLGRVRRADCEYLQGWLAQAEELDNKQARWRTDPSRAGAAGCFGDIGSHCQNLLEFVCGQNITAVAAELTSFVDGRQLDDDGNVLLRFAHGARGVIAASQVAVGEENGLSLRVYGEKGGLRWHQQEPNSLIVQLQGKPAQVYRSAGPGLSAAAAAASRLPAGHVEGYLEAFANLYREFAGLLLARREGDTADSGLLPGIDEAVQGMRFIAAVVESSAQGGQWQNV